MTSSHHADGPGSRALSGPGEFGPRSANDNIARPAGGASGIRGLGLSREYRADGTPIVAIRLILGEGPLPDALIETEDATDIIALWRALGRDFGLPLYLDGMALEPAPFATSSSRRLGSPLSGRRPRFLARRKTPLASIAATLQTA